MDNKEYILNIRVSKDTYKKLRDRAKENGETLSHLVRKTLDDSYEILTDLKHDIFGESEKTTNNIIHYQKVVVAKDIACDRCGSTINKGSQIFVGETKTGGKKYFCSSCFTNS